MQKTIRESNFELLRIVCMLMIICGHLCGHIYANQPFHSAGDLFPFHFIRSFVMTAVNAFIILSGYFSIRFKFDRLFHLVFQVFFFSALMFSTSTLLGWHTFSPVKDFLVYFPIFSNQYWFVTAYIVLYLLSPFLNKASSGLSLSSFRFFLLIGFALFYLWPTFTFLVNASQIVGDAGYGIVNFIYLYFLGRYLRLHARLSHSFRFYFSLFVLSCVLLFVSHYTLSSLLGFLFTSYYSYNTLFIFAGAIFLFCSFSKLHFQSRIVNKLALSCLAVYLIHYGPAFWHNFCNHVLVINQYQGWELIALVLFLPFPIYLICHFMERTRLYLFLSLENKLIGYLSRFKSVSRLIERYSSI